MRPLAQVSQKRVVAGWVSLPNNNDSDSDDDREVPTEVEGGATVGGTLLESTNPMSQEQYDQALQEEQHERESRGEEGHDDVDEAVDEADVDNSGDTHNAFLGNQTHYQMMKQRLDNSSGAGLRGGSGSGSAPPVTHISAKGGSVPYATAKRRRSTKPEDDTTTKKASMAHSYKDNFGLVRCSANSLHYGMALSDAVAEEMCTYSVYSAQQRRAKTVSEADALYAAKLVARNFGVAIYGLDGIDQMRKRKKKNKKADAEDDSDDVEDDDEEDDDAAERDDDVDGEGEGEDGDYVPEDGEEDDDGEEDGEEDDDGDEVEGEEEQVEGSGDEEGVEVD